MITVKRFRRIERAVRDAGYGPIIEWTEGIVEPVDADAFAREAIYVICNSGMKVTVAEPIYQRCMQALSEGQSATTVFGHPGKGPAIDEIWAKRYALFEEYCFVSDKVEFCADIPWIGPVTKYHLAKNFGADVAKPDVHMERLAQAERTTPAKLCKRLAKQTGYRAATVDTILWRACADGILNSRRYEVEGWRGSFRHIPPTTVEIEFPADGSADAQRTE